MEMGKERSGKEKKREGEGGKDGGGEKDVAESKRGERRGWIWGKERERGGGTGRKSEREIRGGKIKGGGRGSRGKGVGRREIGEEGERGKLR